MPEGDTVWLAGRRLDRALAGRQLVRTDFRVPKYAATNLTGRKVLDVVSRGKHLLTRIEGDITLHTHFKMDGSWHVYAAGQRWRLPSHQVRIVLENAEHTCVGVRLAVVELLPTSQEHTVVGHLGPDLLAGDWDAAMAEEARRRLCANPTAEIGMALLDQRNLAGLGNLWRCEVLFLRGVNPYRRIGDITDLPRLIALSQQLMRANRERSGQTATGSLRRGESRYVYGRGGQPCRRCGTPILKADQGDPPYTRETFWCPHCQPG